MYANKMNRTLQRTRDSHLVDTIEYNHVKNVQYIQNMYKEEPLNSCT